MKLQLTMHGTTISVETEDDGLNVTEMLNHFKGLLVAIGYHPTSVEGCLVEDEYQWFPEAEKIEDYLKSEGFEESEEDKSINQMKRSR